MYADYAIWGGGSAWPHSTTADGRQSSLKTDPTQPGKTRPGFLENLTTTDTHEFITNYFFRTYSTVLISIICSLLEHYFMHEIRMNFFPMGVGIHNRKGQFFGGGIAPHHMTYRENVEVWCGCNVHASDCWICLQRAFHDCTAVGKSILCGSSKIILGFLVTNN